MGKLLVDFFIKWRGDLNFLDGSDVNVSLSGGIYDVGDSVKFGFLMVFIVIIFLWSVLEYGFVMEKVG